jgi:outer membrane protein
MKNLLLALILLLAIGTPTQAQQKIAYLDSDYILSKLPAYQQANTQLDELSKRWQQRIEQAYTEIKQMYQQFQAEEALYTTEMKQRKQDEIMAKEQAVRELQNRYFGPEGELYKKRQELVAPLQDELYNAIQTVADQGNYTIVFDKASGLNIVYAQERYDISNDVLKVLGN